jgi:uncharacterized membrane protein YbhN (UPF0104 family)
LKKWLAIGLKAAVSGGLIWYLVANVDMAAVTAHVSTVDIPLLLLSAAVLALQFLIGGLRWNSVLAAMQAPLKTWLAMRLFYIGMFFNQALPGGTGGDAVRMYIAYKSGLSPRAAINGVIVERVATVLALVVLVDATQPLFLPHVPDEMTRIALLAVAGATAAALGGTALLALLHKLPEGLRKWRIVRGLGHLGADTRLVFGRISAALKPLGWSLVGHFNVSVSCFVLAEALGLGVTLLDCVVLIPPVLLIMSIPISIGGWGVREGAMVWMFALVGVSQDAALALSLFFGVVSLAISLPGGIVWLAMRAGVRGANLNDEELAHFREQHENA